MLAKLNFDIYEAMKLPAILASTFTDKEALKATVKTIHLIIKGVKVIKSINFVYYQERRSLLQCSCT